MRTIRRPPSSTQVEPVTLAFFLFPVLVFVGVAYVLYAGYLWSFDRVKLPSLPASLT